MSDELAADGAGEPGRVPDRRVLLAAGLAASLLLGGGAFLLLGGEEEVDEVVFAVPRRAAVAVAEATPTPVPSASAHRHPVPENPFLARVVDAPATQPGEPVDPGAAPLPPAGALPVGELPVDPAGDPTALPGPLPTDLPTGLPTTVPSTPTDVPTSVPTSAPTAAPTTAPTGPTAPARHTLVLTRVTGSAPDLVGRFLVDGDSVLVATADDASTGFGPGGVVALLGLEQVDGGWTAVVQVGTAEPVNLPAGRVLRFG